MRTTPVILPWISQKQAYALLRELAEASLLIAAYRAEIARLNAILEEAIEDKVATAIRTKSLEAERTRSSVPLTKRRRRRERHLGGGPSSRRGF